MGLLSRLKSLFSKKGRNVTIGLALGSGGAKGMAHLGALKAFEEEKIEFSCLTGSSIGAIVGALYANGYTSSDMVEVVRGVNRKEFSKNLRPYADLSNIERFLESYLEGNISDLKKPFAAWATKENGEGVLLREGKTAKILTASAAIPPFFRAVEIDGEKYYDGAFSNSVPADACRELGAELVIAIDLSAYERVGDGVISRFASLAMERLTPIKKTADYKSRGYDAADCMLKPDLSDFRATDIGPYEMDAMFERGYKEARARMSEIKALIEGKRRERR